jgi:trans-aconitate methyltransferase
MSWQHGYFADEGYAYSFHRHQTPANIAFAALLQGHRPPDLKGPFHYLDLGCGQGIVTCVLAAAYPQARFTGVDFHPEHIAHARQLAADCALSNVHFEEADFLDLARELPPAWPPADFAVAHGIAST